MSSCNIRSSNLRSSNIRSNQVAPATPASKPSPSGPDQAHADRVHPDQAHPDQAGAAQPVALRLRRDDGHRGDAIPFDRRLSVRRAVSGHVTAVCREQGEDGPRNRICALSLVDMSGSGLGAFCQEAIPDGAGITVFFPPHGPDRGFDAYGQVLRCEAAEGGYRVGIQFVGRVAA
jgi:hypothetical protein